MPAIALLSHSAFIAGGASRRATRRAARRPPSLMKQLLQPSFFGGVGPGCRFVGRPKRGMKLGLTRVRIGSVGARGVVREAMDRARRWCSRK
jgi:hypothetical protein